MLFKEFAVTVYATCADADFDPATGTCAHVVYVQQPSLLPPLSVDEGLQIGTAIFVAWAIAWGFTALGRVLD